MFAKILNDVMENPTVTNVMESSSYSQVIFDDIHPSYPPNTQIVCHYIVTAGLQPNPRDWVGICKVGWSSMKDYHTFVWVEPSLDVVGQDSVRKQVLFREYYLPKDETEFYQFCYVDSNGIVKGVSTPFSFKTTEHIRQDCSLEDDLLVITTQIKVEESEREKNELLKELEQERKQNEIFKVELEKKQQEIEHLKVSTNDLAQQVFKQEQQLQKKDATEKEEMTQSTTSLNESQKRQKVSQLKQERDDLRKEVEAKSAEIAQLNRKVKESEQEYIRTKDNIQLQQVDLQSSEREKERLLAELDKLHGLTDNLEELKKENQKLRRNLSERESVVEMVDGDLNIKYQTLQRQNQETHTKLLQQIRAVDNAQRRAEDLERELQDTLHDLECRSMAMTQEKQKSSKLEMQLAELYINLEEKANMAEITKKENEELTGKNQKLKRDIEKLQREFAGLQATPLAVPVSLQHSNPSSSSPDLTNTEEQDREGSDSLHYGNPYEIMIGSATDPEVELSLECRHCQEKFPGITQDELDQHEQSHRVCPFCTLICDSMEQAVFEDHVYNHEV
ncbi:calcium-binding and coiled-coil domain-containing protein 2 isoform X3 [Hypomesus transpacificus]|uniref:calcium-binding and coiled-coil domain-containing protein 2 isoform X3 n=2 Tax=Hypomesus transpacificus TaxID=137520 RepID=UPI001F0740AC|nr:calcium-binding and coiled-coil domain-containing protein 2 isoform X3 [Hypomesus transpacificus]